MKRAAPLVNRRHVIAALAGICAAKDPTAFAQSTLARLIVGFAPGGTSDVVARTLATPIGAQGDTNTIVENRVGAGGRIGIEYVKTSKPDGKTVLVTPSDAIVLFPHTYKNLPYDPLKDFTPVARLVEFPLLLAVGPRVPSSVKSVADLIVWFKANPADAFYAIASAGNLPHFVSMSFAKAAGIDLTAAVYKGDAPAIQDVIAGQVAMNITAAAAQWPFLESRKLRLLATASPTRLPELPELPTLVESGLAVSASGWYGAFVPKATPPSVVQKLQGAFEAALSTPEVRDKLSKLQLAPAFASGSELTEQIKKELAGWGPIVRSSGFSAE